MNWFYAQNGQQVGPVDEGELDGLIQRGAITAGTLVWHAGMASWQPYTQARPAGGPVVATGAAGYAGVPIGGYVGAGQARCTECGQIFPEDDVVRLGNAQVCARCKPLALQKLREGALLNHDLPYAGFWIRFAAVLFDGLIFLAIYAILGIVVYYFFSAQVNSTEGNVLSALYRLFSIAVDAVYETYFIGRYGATLGKMVCNLRVVRPDNTRLTYMRALGRHFAKWLSGIILSIGYIMAAFDSEKRALHDQICDTRVVYKG